MKKIIALLLALVMVFALAACASKTEAPAEETKTETAATETATEEKTEQTTEEPAAETAAPADFKVGFIMLHDENSTYDLNFINGAKEAAEALGVEYVIKTNVPEGQECYDAAADLADAGCNIVFADSFGHEDYMIQAAKEFPDVQFCHSTGTKAHTENLANYHNAFASIYEGRYLAGIVAGMKLNEMIEAGQFTADEAKIGYVGAFTYAEVISGYTSFFLGARSVCPTAGVPDVSYNGSTQAACPNTYLVSSRIDWAPYYKYAITAAMNGEAIDADWTGTLATGSVVLTELNENVVAAGTAEAVEAAKAELEAGTRHVYDVTTFTVDGQQLTSSMADVDTDPDYTPDTEAIVDGYFAESTFRSAPYFQLNIDGITLLDTAF